MNNIRDIKEMIRNRKSIKSISRTPKKLKKRELSLKHHLSNSIDSITILLLLYQTVIIIIIIIKQLIS
ncbi:hypothetical protein Glove_117g539 [Diversispora epigaea]|uniref:Uncharacterized protein n=1 Tax=Diversispora epigaea TaxID=1348612 RepID=A0A397J8W9_9GLOM|nr:hypothetical protein Glove_117g539 [Diversispora epigaea]